MRIFRSARLALLAGSLHLATVAAQEPSIDNLLKKLPPPEKLVKNPVQSALQQPDPALKDPLGQQILVAEQMRNLPGPSISRGNLRSAIPAVPLRIAFTACS